MRFTQKCGLQSVCMYMFVGRYFPVYIEDRHLHMLDVFLPFRQRVCVCVSVHVFIYTHAYVNHTDHNS